MVDVAGKAVTERFARARALVRMSAATAEALRAVTLPKGDAFVAAHALLRMMLSKEVGIAPGDAAPCGHAGSNAGQV